MPFSRRTAWDTEEGSLARTVREAREAGREIIDLTLSNPARCGFTYPANVLTGLADAAALRYDPDPRGISTARAAVAGYYAEHGARVDPDALILTTSTSEAYSFLFRVLCDPGDEVLVASPSYPLFDFIADLDGVRLRTYPLFYDFGWWIDFAELERRITAATRAVLLVHPNNPTGHATSSAERGRLQELCARHNLTLIVDEVFLDYGLAEPVATFASAPLSCLTIVVSGLSKVAALPQMKVGWLLVLGPGARSQELLTRLEIVADTFLSMNAPAQHALPGWLATREFVTEQVRARIATNYQHLVEHGGEVLASLPVQAGWSVVVLLPQRLGAAVLAEQLVREAGVVVHPGSFYGFAEPHRIVLSLLVPHESFLAGLTRLKSWCKSTLEVL